MIGEITNHVWQTTVFAAAAGLMTLAFRKNRAQVRYWLWLSASLKFLLPFSVLITLGSSFGWAPVPQKFAAAPAVTLTVLQVSQPFRDTLSFATPARDARNWVAIAIFSVWACGFAAIALIRFRGWRRIRAAMRASTPVEIPAAIEVRSSADLLEPGVVGMFRPILLLPAGILERLTPRQWQAVLAHEACHVNRRDNLTAAAHMIVEAVFWFHPLVWWIGARLVEERERACDEAVLLLGNAPHDYAEGILRVYKSYLESPLCCISGVTGSDLKKRIQAILTGRTARDLSFAKKTLLAAAAIAALAIPVMAGILKAPGTPVESPTATSRFENATIKSCNAFHKPNPREESPKSFQSECTSTERLIQQAYGLFANGKWNLGSSLTVSGGPAWIRSDLYEIDARTATPEGRAMMNGPMLQSLLGDRFKLKVHRDTREIPVYSLTAAAAGPNLQPFRGSCTPRDFDKPPSQADCSTVRMDSSGFEMRAATMADLCAGLSTLLDRHVVDETGIAGRFNMHVDLSAEGRDLLKGPRSLPAVSNPTVPPPASIPLSAARSAVKNLGLNLEPGKSPGEFLVVDHIERPSSD